MDIEGMEVTVVVNGMTINGLSYETAAGLLADAREGVSVTAFGTKYGQGYLFAGPLAVAVSFAAEPDQVASTVTAAFDYLADLSAKRAAVRDDLA